MGNCPPKTTDQDIRALFSPCGTVLSIRPSTAEITVANPRFILEMAEPEAVVAIRTLNGSMHQGCRLDVWESMQRVPKPKKK